jgi:O-antigen/teichoic acid export membrane protein
MVGLGKLADPIFTVLFLEGHSKWLVVIAAFTGFLHFLTRVSTSSTMSIFGKPESTSDSTLTSNISTHSSAPEKVLAIFINQWCPRFSDQD